MSPNCSDSAFGVRPARAPFVMHFADSGEAALERLSGNIELALIAVLSDINMPVMDGLQLLGAIKQRCPDLPVMMVTAYEDDDRRRGRGAVRDLEHSAHTPVCDG